ncbi:MAG: hypothetical protein ACOCWH_04285, partial [Spirochaetota bacterium]
RFEEMQRSSNQRFEQVDKRFEEMQRSSNQRFEEMQRSNDQRFEQIDKRFEDMNAKFRMMLSFMSLGFTILAILITVFKFFT